MLTAEFHFDVNNKPRIFKALLHFRTPYQSMLMPMLCINISFKLHAMGNIYRFTDVHAMRDVRGRVGFGGRSLPSKLTVS